MDTAIRNHRIVLCHNNEELTGKEEEEEDHKHQRERKSSRNKSNLESPVTANKPAGAREEEEEAAATACKERSHLYAENKAESVSERTTEIESFYPLGA